MSLDIVLDYLQNIVPIVEPLFSAGVLNAYGGALDSVYVFGSAVIGSNLLSSIWNKY